MTEPSPSITPAVQANPAAQRRLQRHRTLMKLASIGVLALLMLIPLALLMPVVSERSALRDVAVEEIHRDWGRAQTIVGPVLVIPTDNGGFAYAFPDELQVDGALAPEQRSRGIYASVVYAAKLTVGGTFHRPTAGELGVAPEKLRWDQAHIAIGISDLRGTGTEVTLQWGAAKHAMLPGAYLDRYSSGLHVRVAVPVQGSIAFSLDVPLHGSEKILFAPLGIRNAISVRSAWPNPSFTGAFLPATREVTASGFSSTWSVSYYGRDFGQYGAAALPPALDSSLFGVELLPGIDSYRSVDRAVRYGILFVVLALMSFFLFEVITRTRIHPFQYAMVGVALAVFFLLLLALSELVSFVAAYSAAAAGTIGLVTMYMLPVLRTGRRTFVASALLGASFGVLYVVLQAEDYALLAGALVVFVALAITMRLTRALDWYAEDATSSGPAPTSPPQSPPASEEAR